jgi:hypothetical protein
MSQLRHGIGMFGYLLGMFGLLGSCSILVTDSTGTLTLDKTVTAAGVHDADQPAFKPDQIH